MSFDPISYAMGRQAGGGGGGVTVEPLAVTENGTYTAEGKAYSPVTVEVNNADAPEKDVNLYDLNGRRLFSFTKSEVSALTELPDAPDVPDLHLAFGGWNWTLAEINAQPGYVEVGACYEPTDCDCALVIEPNLKSQLYVTVRVYVTSGSSVRIEWGDGTDADEYSGGASQIVATHEYAECKRYRIRFTLTGTASLTLGGAANSNLLYGTHNDLQSQAPLVELYAGSNCEFPTVSTSAASLYRCTFGANTKLDTARIGFVGECFALPRNSNYSREYTKSAYLTKAKIIPAGATLLPFAKENGFRHAGGTKITIPSGVTTIAPRAIMDNPGLSTVQIPQTVSTIAATGIHHEVEFNTLREIWFHGEPPTLSASNALSIYTTARIFVPFSSLAAYLTGTNYPDPADYTYTGFELFTSGAPLPTQDSTGTYNVTWYASKEDAAVGANPITAGNGKEIYCDWEVAV